MAGLRRYKVRFGFGGFTLVELLMALVITSLVLAAVASLAYALSAASDSTGDLSEKQAHLRYATLRIGELLRHCKIICGVPGGDLAIWRADDNVNSKININELVYITAGSGSLTLVEFDSSGNSVISRSGIGSLSTEWWLTYNGNTEYTQLIPECTNVLFEFDTAPPETRFVSISFEIPEDGIVRRYQINGFLRGWSEDLLDESGEIVTGDDDWYVP